MSNKMWDALLEHAKTCVLSGKLYVYYPEDTRNVGVVFNNIYQLSGLIAGEQFHSADDLSDSQKVNMNHIVSWKYVLAILLLGGQSVYIFGFTYFKSHFLVLKDLYLTCT